MFKFIIPLLFILCISLVPQNAMAGTIIKFGLDSLDPNIVFDGVVGLETDDDGNIAPGDQQSNLDFTGFLNAIQADAAVGAGASVSIRGIAATGVPMVINLLPSQNVILQRTLGGVFDFFAPESLSNPGVYELLLTGEIGDGEIYGIEGSTVAHFRSTSSVVFTGGSLLPYLAPDSGSISISFTQVNQGFHLNAGLPPSLANFSADATGNVTAEMVPEPATLLAFVLLGATGFRLRGRRKKISSSLVCGLEEAGSA